MTEDTADVVVNAGTAVLASTNESPSNSNEMINSRKFITTVCRLSPSDSPYNCLIDDTMLTVNIGNEQKEYVFDKIFAANSKQENIADFFANKIDDFLNGESQTVMAVGSSGSGKSFTMIGTGDNDLGLIGNVITKIFEIGDQMSLAL